MVPLTALLLCLAAAYNGVRMDPEQFGINIVPYYIDAKLQPHVLSVEQLQSHSATDLDFLLAHTDQAIPSLEACFSLFAEPLIYRHDLFPAVFFSSYCCDYLRQHSSYCIGEAGLWR